MTIPGNAPAKDNESNVSELFAKVTSVEETLKTPSHNVDGVEESLNLYGICMGIAAESTTVPLNDAQRAEFNERMDRIDSKLQEQAMQDFFS